MQTPDSSGVYPGIEAEDYHRWSAFSISNGLELLKSPGHYLYRLNNPIEPTPAMELGTNIHLRLLEPDKFGGKFAFLPDHIPNDKRTKLYKEFVEQVPPGRKILSSSDARIIEAINQSVRSRLCTQELLWGEGESELSLFWEDEATGIKCKGRLDRIHYGLNMLVDIKTTKDASPVGFAKNICNRGYYIQQAHYRDGARSLGIKIDHVIFIAIETVAPYGVGVYSLPNHALDAGLEHRNLLLKQLSKCYADNTWETFPDKITPLEFPDWAFSSVERALAYQ